MASFPSRCRSCRPLAAIAKADGYAQNDTDNYTDMERQFPQLQGAITCATTQWCWANVECATEGLAGLRKFPNEEILAAAAQTLRR